MKLQFFFSGKTPDPVSAVPKDTAVDAATSNAAMASNPQVQRVLAQYAAGTITLAQAQGAIGKLGEGFTGNARDGGVDVAGALASLYTSPSTGTKAATDQVLNNPLYAGMFGKDGLGASAQANYGKYGDLATSLFGDSRRHSGMADAMEGNLADDRNALMGRDQSYGLTDQDLAAYGQASGNIARNFASNNANLAQSLADRGLSQGGSMSAIANFGGSMGNQNEQLAQLQSGIAQNRIQTAASLAQARTNADIAHQGQLYGAAAQDGSQAGTATNAQANAGNLALGVSSFGKDAVGQQYGMNTAGTEEAYNKLASAAGLNVGNYTSTSNGNNSQAAATNSANPSLAIPGMIAGLLPSIIAPGTKSTTPTSNTTTVGSI